MNDLLSILNGHIEHSRKVEQDLAELRNEVENLRKNPKASDDEEEDLSDDEDSVADESDHFTTMFRQLREYRESYGDCKVSKASKNPRLSAWIGNQRAGYRTVKTGQKGRKISPDKILKLDSIGFYWGSNFLDPPS